MGSKANLVQEWNEIVSFKISENDLTNPTYERFVEALESLLLKLSISFDDFRANDYHEDSERIMLIKLVQHVNKLYSLNDSQFDFFFTDLINPTSKKCCHVLKMLLNYLKFYEMQKKELLDRANKHLVDFNAALTEKNQLEEKIEAMKKHAQLINNAIAEFKTKEPKIDVEVARLKAENQKLDDIIETKSREINEFEVQTLRLRISESELRDQVVDEQTYEKQLASLEVARANREAAQVNLNELRARFAEEQDIVQATAASLAEMDQTIEKMKEQLKDFDELITTEANYHRLVEYLQEAETTAQNLKKEFNEIQKNIQKKQEMIETKQRESTEIQNQITKTLEFHDNEISKLNEDIKGQQLSLNVLVEDIQCEAEKRELFEEISTQALQKSLEFPFGKNQ